MQQEKNYLVVCPRFLNYEKAYTMPLGLACVIGALRAVRQNVMVLDLNYKENELTLLANTILENNIDCLAVGGTSMAYAQVKQVLDTAKKVKPSITTMVGGGLITAAPQTAMCALQNADIGMIGEGEHTIVELADTLEAGGALSGVKGIIYRGGSGEPELIWTAERPEIEDLDALPFPDYDGLEIQRILACAKEVDGRLDSSKSMTICTSRSCPYKCTFCFHTCGNRYRKRGLDSVFAELDLLVAKYDFSSLYIVDELFISDKQRLQEFCERITPYHLTWFCQARADNIAPEMLEQMRTAGCTDLGFGLESANNGILKTMNKHISIEQIETALACAHHARIHTWGAFLLGDRYETVQSFASTLDWICAHPQYTVDIARIIILPGSELYRYALETGVIKDEIDYWEKGFPYINITKMSDEEYAHAWQEARELLDTRVASPKSLKILAQSRSSITTCLVCPSCGEECIGEETDLFADLTHAAICKVCGKNMQTPLYSCLKDVLEEKLLAYLQTNVIAVYGLGRMLRRWMSISELPFHKNIVIIDRAAQAEEGYSFKSKRIFAPDSLPEWGCSLVLHAVRDSNFIGEIQADVANRLPSMPPVCSLNEYFLSLLEETDVTGLEFSQF